MTPMRVHNSLKLDKYFAAIEIFRWDKEDIFAGNKSLLAKEVLNGWME